MDLFYYLYLKINIFNSLNNYSGSWRAFGSVPSWSLIYRDRPGTESRSNRVDITIWHHFERLSLLLWYLLYSDCWKQSLSLFKLYYGDGCCLAIVIITVHYLRTSTGVIVDSSLAFRFYRFIPLKFYSRSTFNII